MRFLLHPTPAHVRKSALKAVKGMSTPLGKTTVVSSASSNASSKVKTSWGQQCSENCGCVVRFQAHVDAETNTVIAAEYTAKTVITTSNGNNERLAVLTQKGRPMFKHCTCPSVHQLSQGVVNYMNSSQRDWNKLYADLCEFETTRSSPAFRKAALLAQNLPAQDTHCFDVVEEAVTAMMKGYMPKARPKATPLPKRRQNSNPVVEDDDFYRHYYSQRNHDQYYDEGTHLPFGSLFEWREEQQPLKQPMFSPSSTLNMFDLAMTEQERESGSKKRIPDDWVSYVDEVNNNGEDQSSSA